MNRQDAKGAKKSKFEPPRRQERQEDLMKNLLRLFT
jgi:hypothetical protein